VNKATIVAPSSCRSYWSSHNRRSYDEIQPTFISIPPPVTWFRVWADTFLGFIEFLCWSIRYMFPECRLLHEKLNAFNRSAVGKTCVICGVKIVWIGQSIVTDSSRFPIVNAHYIEHLLQSSKSSVGWKEVTHCCHRRVPGKPVDDSSARVVLDALVHWSILLLHENSDHSSIWWSKISKYSSPLGSLASQLLHCAVQ